MRSISRRTNRNRAESAEQRSNRTGFATEKNRSRKTYLASMRAQVPPKRGRFPFLAERQDGTGPRLWRELCTRRGGAGWGRPEQQDRTSREKGRSSALWGAGAHRLAGKRDGEIMRSYYPTARGCTAATRGGCCGNEDCRDASCGASEASGASDPETRRRNLILTKHESAQ